MNVAIYLRVSTDMQDHARQERDLLQWCSNAQHNVVHILREKESGAKTDRKERQKLIGFAKGGAFEAVVVTELSRWSRSTTDLLETLEVLSVDGVRLIALNGPDFDIAKPLGKMMLTVLGAVAEFERGLIQERIKSGLAAKRARGEKLGRAPGDDWRVRQIKAKMAKEHDVFDGLSLRDKAARLGCSVNTLRKAMA